MQRVFLIFLLSVALLGGCAKKKILPGYDRTPSRQVFVRERDFDPATVPPGWGVVDICCRKGVGKARGYKDTLFGNLLYAREHGTGVIRLPHGVYLGHVAEFIVKALKFYHITTHFERFVGYRLVLVFRPATPEETKKMRDPGWVELGTGAAGDAALSVFGAPLVVPIVAPICFAFEAVSTDLDFQSYKKQAQARGLPVPTRRGDEIAKREVEERYEGYVQSLKSGGEEKPVSVMTKYVVVRCFLEIPRKGRRALVHPLWGLAK